MTDAATRVFLGVFDTPSGSMAGFDERFNHNPRPSADHGGSRILFSGAGVEHVLAEADAERLPMNAATRAEYEKALAELRACHHERERREAGR